MCIQLPSEEDEGWEQWTVRAHLRVLSQLPETRRFIWGIHAISLTGASCIATVWGCPPDSRGHILTCLSQPPEKTVVPSSFQAEQRTWNRKKINWHTRHYLRGSQCTTTSRKALRSYRLIMRYGYLRLTVPANNLPAPHLHNTQSQPIQVRYIIHHTNKHQLLVTA